MEFSRQECWSGLPFPFPGDLPNLGTEPRSPAFQADSLLSEPPGSPTKTKSFQMNLIFFSRKHKTGKKKKSFIPRHRYESFSSKQILSNLLLKPPGLPDISSSCLKHRGYDGKADLFRNSSVPHYPPPLDSRIVLHTAHI